MSLIVKRSTLVASLIASFVLLSSVAAAEEKKAQTTFETPRAAGEALFAAAKGQDQSALLAILGADSKDLISSGDPGADKAARAKFVGAYQAKHHWRSAPGDRQILDVGKNVWPFPIPLVDTASGWRFDAEAGREEIVDRRIGRDELSAIQACLAFVDAQNEYYERNPMGGTPRYAQSIASTPGKKDGLFWKTKEGEGESPLGELFAAAHARGHERPTDSTPSYKGYLYRVLLEQGDAAHGGVLDYVVEGEMTRGFALIAWPVEYGVSGVMTFLVNQTGVVYQKDLGPDTAAIAAGIEAFDPDLSWDVVSADARKLPGVGEAS